jgi:hypothetical protein
MLRARFGYGAPAPRLAITESDAPSVAWFDLPDERLAPRVCTDCTGMSSYEPRAA